MPEKVIYDIVIVGLGPAAVTAALYSYRNNLKTLLVGESFGGATLVSGEIENWPGIISTTGFELSEKMEEQLKKYCMDETCMKRSLIKSIVKNGEFFSVIDKDETEYVSKSVIYATGGEPRKLNIPGEQEYRNHGVTYCATCDGPLYRGKDVAIIGGGNSALKSAHMMKNIAKSVLVVTINPEFMGEQISIKQLEKAESEGRNVRTIKNGKTIEIKGNDKFVESVVIEHLDSKEKEEIKVQGVFVEIGLRPITEPVKNLGLEINAAGEIVANREMKTNIPGFFVAGDVSDLRDKQIIVASGTGCIAALSASEYLAKLGG